MNQPGTRYIRITPTRANKLVYHIRTLLLLIDIHKNNLACYPEGCYYDIVYSKLLKEVFEENKPAIRTILNSSTLLTDNEKQMYLDGYQNLPNFMNVSTPSKTNEANYKPIQYLLHRTFVVIDTIRSIFAELYETYLKSFDTNQGLNCFDNQEATIVLSNAETYSMLLGIYRNIVRITLFEPFETDTCGLMGYYNSIIEIHREIECIRYALDLDSIDPDEIEPTDFKYLFIHEDDYRDNIDVHDFLVNEYNELHQVFDRIRFREQWYKDITYMDVGKKQVNGDDW